MVSLTSLILLTLTLVHSSLGQDEEVCYNKPCQRIGEEDDNCACHPYACYPTGPGLPGACKCDTTITVEHPNNPERCVPFASEIGDSCAELPSHGLCRNVPHTFCNGTHCACTPQSHFDYTFPNNRSRVCIPYTPSLGDWCFIPEQCNLIPGSQCDHVYERCICNSEHYESQFGIKRCLRYAVELYDNCTEEAKQCERLGDSIVCSNGICVCADDHFHHQPSPPYCLPFLHNIGSDCLPGSRQCEPIDGAECSALTRKCACDSNHALHPSGQQCVHLICSTCLGDTCTVGTVPEQCSLIPGAQCHPNTLRCSCSEGYYQNGTHCLPYAQVPGAPCFEAHQCSSIPGTHCVNNGCICQDHLDVSLDGHRCYLRPTQVGGPCESIVNCRHILNTDCTGGGCNCLPEHVTSASRTQCLPIIPKLGAQCEETAQCSYGIGSNSLCYQSVCQCMPGFVERIGEGSSPDECIPFALKPDDPCVEEQQCDNIPGTDCVEGFCSCWPQFDISMDESGCFLRPTRVGGPCESPSNCRDIPNTDCAAGACGCIPAHIPTSDNSRCLPIVFKLGTFPCEENGQCNAGIGGHSLCTSGGVCGCLPGFVEGISEGGAPDLCLPVSQHEGPCSHHVQCTIPLGPEAECSTAEKCSCKTTAGFHNNGCHLKRPLHSTCSSSEECIVGSNEWSGCTNGSCQCLPGSVETPTSSGIICLPDRRVGSPCEMDEECSAFINGIVLCNGGRCTCGFTTRPTEDMRVCTSGGSSIFFSVVLFMVVVIIVKYL